MNNEKEIIARRVAMEIEDGNVVNLGIGLPELVANYIPEGMDVNFQAENGILGMGGTCKPGEENKDVINAGCKHVQVNPGAMFFDSATSFAFIRGGHVDVTVLGVLEIDETGTFASHKIPGKKVPGMGGAMDLVMGAKKVIVATTHTKRGEKTIVKKISLPATAVSKVDLIITELAVIRVTREGLVLEEISSNTTVEEVQSLTEPKLIISDNLKTMFA